MALDTIIVFDTIVISLVDPVTLPPVMWRREHFGLLVYSKEFTFPIFLLIG
jgi:hypothetical protein